MLSHSHERPFVCKVCGTGFRQRSNLNRHLRTVHELPLKCPAKNCRERFKTLDDARAHIAKAHPDSDVVPSTKKHASYKCVCLGGKGSLFSFVVPSLFDTQHAKL